MDLSTSLRAALKEFFNALLETLSPLAARRAFLAIFERRHHQEGGLNADNCVQSFQPSRQK